MSDDILKRARETTGQQIAERMIEQAYDRRDNREDSCGIFIDFLRAEYPALGLTSMSRFNRMDREFRVEALEKFRQRGSRGPWLTGEGTDTLRFEQYPSKREFVETAAGARRAEKPGIVSRYIEFWPWALMGFALLYFGWHVVNAAPGFWSGGK